MKYLVFITIIFSLIACDQRSDYERLIQDGQRSDVRHDSLFLGYELGMEQQQFLDHSWQLNQEGLITGGTQIEYRLTDLSYDARMVFYPHFENGKIYKMPIEISYNSWAIWNRELYSEHMINDLLEYYENIYGTGFRQVDHPVLNRQVWMKVDGNRKIVIYPKDDMITRVEFTDLSVQKE
ncbi:hypothetical protein [Rhodohalobacter sp. SW132]|uniref:hypothetical protein n=1 Tax=Rhodohalobacter sp. SW132 TaxID=2293433 RepID=UPI0011C02984|nr:hypothetical protein [Rhodohalobacter sp. SW132]